MEYLPSLAELTSYVLYMDCIRGWSTMDVSTYATAPEYPGALHE